MNFRPELAALVMNGRKTVTRRACSSNERSPWYRERCSLVEGRDYAVCPGRGKNQIGRMLVTRVEFETFAPSEITDDEALREGFDAGPDGAWPAESFAATWRELHGNLDPVEVWRIEFRALTPVDPIVEAISSHRYTISDELQLQDALADVLQPWAPEREVYLTSGDRIDLLAARIGIEVKVAGNAQRLAAQVARYAKSDELDAIIVVTTVARHLGDGGTANGKPVQVVLIGGEL